MKHLLLLLTLFVFTMCGNKPEEEDLDLEKDIEVEFDPTAIMSIREIMETHYKDVNFHFGAAAKMGYFGETGLENAIVRRYISEFNYNTPENDFKQAQVYKTPGDNWNSKGYMQQIEAARKYGMVIRAHGPISPQCSGWAKEDNRTPQELSDMLTHFMTELSKDLEKNKDVVKWMDVVNETLTQSTQKNGIGYDGKQSDIVYKPEDWFGPRKGTGSWENPWPLIGFETLTYNDNGETKSINVPKYIRMAFKLANEYAPSIKKIYNEHGGSINTVAWEKIKNTILALRANGTRIDGVGWQAHVSVGWENEGSAMKDLEDIIKWCGENDLEFHITELDIAVTGYESSLNYAALEATRNEQAATIASILNLLLRYIDKGACGINFWVMNDRYSGRSYASIFNVNGEPNEIYYRVKQQLIDHIKKNK